MEKVTEAKHVEAAHIIAHDNVQLHLADGAAPDIEAKLDRFHQRQDQCALSKLEAELENKQSFIRQMLVYNITLASYDKQQFPPTTRNIVYVLHNNGFKNKEM